LLEAGEVGVGGRGGWERAQARVVCVCVGVRRSRPRSHAHGGHATAAHAQLARAPRTEDVWSSPRLFQPHDKSHFQVISSSLSSRSAAAPVMERG
jgi:hypothetical protein